VTPRRCSTSPLLSRSAASCPPPSTGYSTDPGTLLGHPRLSTLLKPEERAELEAMDPAALWALERKRDVDLDAIYGPGHRRAPGADARARAPALAPRRR